MKTLAIS